MEQKKKKNQCYTNITKESSYVQKKRDEKVAEKLKGGENE